VLCFPLGCGSCFLIAFSLIGSYPCLECEHAIAHGLRGLRNAVEARGRIAVDTATTAAGSGSHLEFTAA
jgi:hypothetical protein